MKINHKFYLIHKLREYKEYTTLKAANELMCKWLNESVKSRLRGDQIKIKCDNSVSDK